METREELIKQYDKWTVEYMKAKEEVEKLQPPVANLSEGEPLVAFVVTEQSLADYEKAEKKMNRASRKRIEILKRLQKHSSH